MVNNDATMVGDASWGTGQRDPGAKKQQQQQTAQRTQSPCCGYRGRKSRHGIQVFLQLDKGQEKREYVH